jgi:hypothetical protein
MKKKLLALIIGIALLCMTGIANSATYDASGTWNMSFTCDYYIDPPPGSSIFQYTYSYDSTWEIVQDPDDDTFSLGITASPYPGTQWYTGIVMDAHYEVTGPTGHFHDTDYVWGLSYDLEGNIPWMGDRWWLIMWDSLYFDLSSDGTALEGFGDPEWIGYNYSDPDGSDEQFSTYVEGLEPWEDKEFSGTVPIPSDCDDAIQIPTSQSAWYYSQVVNPVMQSNPASCKPFSVGNLSTGNLSLYVGLCTFSSEVDVYLAIGFSNELFLIDGSDMLHPASELTVLPQWKTNNTAVIYKSLYGDIPTSLLPPGTYDLYLVVVPTGATDFSHYYFWYTSFSIGN